MTFKDFYQKFSDEATCRNYWRQLREQQGIVCKNCQGKEHGWRSGKQMWECKSCKFRTSLRSGTVMENSKLPFKYWLAGMQFLTVNKKSFSALSVQKELEHKRYEPVWAMLHKLRLVMGHRDARYTLKNVVELDEGFFEHVTDKSSTDSNQSSSVSKRGRGSKRQSKVLVAVESVAMTEEQIAANAKKHDKSRKVGYLKMTVMDTLNSNGISYEVGKTIDPNAEVVTDGYKGYTTLNEKVRKHTKVAIEKPEDAGKLLPWVHTAIANAKRLLLGVFHRIGQKYMQNYLNEYCYRFNRRYFNEAVFDRLAIAGVSYTWY